MIEKEKEKHRVSRTFFCPLLSLSHLMSSVILPDAGRKDAVLFFPGNFTVCKRTVIFLPEVEQFIAVSLLRLLERDVRKEI